MNGRKHFTGVFLAVVFALTTSVAAVSGAPELTIVYSNNINGYVQPCNT